MSDPRFTMRDLHGAAERELEIRKRKYPEWVAGGRLRAGKAQRELAMFQAIVDHFQGLIQQ